MVTAELGDIAIDEIVGPVLSTITLVLLVSFAPSPSSTITIHSTSSPGDTVEGLNVMEELEPNESPVDLLVHV